MTLPRLLVILLATVLSDATAQTSKQIYTYRSIDFRWDSINGNYLYGTQLGAVLLRGYLSNQLKAYKFDVRQELSKFKPLPEKYIPDQWDPPSDYFAGDRVTYKGKYYEARRDLRGQTPGLHEYWRPLNLTGEAASNLHYFPTAADTTTKAELLTKFIRYEDEYLADSWMPEVDYYSFDFAEFNGQYYQCLQDSRGRKPDTETEYWRVRPRRLTLQTPGDLLGIQLLYAGAEPSPLVPQLLSVNRIDYEMMTFSPIGLNFKYQDAMTYLARQPELPLVCRSRLGYTGSPQMLIGYANANNVLHFLRTKLMEGKLAPTKNGILSATDYDMLMNMSHDDLTLMWSLTQNMTTNDIELSALRNELTGTTYTRTVKFDWKSVEPLLAADAPAPRTVGYMEGIESKLFSAFSDTVSYDSLGSMPFTPVTMPTPTARYFIDQRAATIASNPKLAVAIQGLWTQLRTAVASDAIKLQPNEMRPFLCDQPFHAMTISRNAQWEIAEGFQLESTPAVKLDSLYARLPAAGIIAEYRRVLTAQPSKVQPVTIQRIGIRLFFPDGGFYVDYFFKLDDVKRIAGAQKEMKALMAAVVKGTLVFDAQSVVGGLIGVNR